MIAQAQPPQIIALTQEDIWFNGEKIVPINSEIHGTYRPDVIRDRITGNTDFVIVLRGDGYYQNGTELVVKGKILDRGMTLMLIRVCGGSLMEDWHERRNHSVRE